MRLLLLSFVVLAWSAGPIITPAPAPATSSVAELELAADAAFAALHAEANAALERLRASQDRRMAMAAPTAL